MKSAYRALGQLLPAGLSVDEILQRDARDISIASGIPYQEITALQQRIASELLEVIADSTQNVSDITASYIFHTSLPSLDAALHGGFKSGTVVELLSSDSTNIQVAVAFAAEQLIARDTSIVLLNCASNIKPRDIASCLDTRFASAPLLPEELCDMLNALQVCATHDLYSLLNALWSVYNSSSGKIAVLIDGVDRLLSVVAGTSAESSFQCHLLSLVTQLARRHILVLLTRTLAGGPINGSAKGKPYASLWSDVVNCAVMVARSEGEVGLDMKNVQWRITRDDRSV